MVVTDFDGTLFSDEERVRSKDYETLVSLGETNIKRVIATGRSLYSAEKVINDDFPIDYLIFSSGAGIMNWKTKIIEHKFSISSDLIRSTLNVLEYSGLDFMLHKKIPENHFIYPVKQTAGINSDFESRCRIYSDFILSCSIADIKNIKEACQFVVIIDLNENDSPEAIYLSLKNQLPDLKVIRATSPIDKKSLWVEIFSNKVSKANAADIICKKEKIKKDNVMVIGNDYNDLDMLEWGGRNSFVVENAPLEFRKKFRVVGSNNRCGFTEAVESWFKSGF